MNALTAPFTDSSNPQLPLPPREVGRLHLLLLPYPYTPERQEHTHTQPFPTGLGSVLVSFAQNTPEKLKLQEEFEKVVANTFKQIVCPSCADGTATFASFALEQFKAEKRSASKWLRRIS